MPSGRISSSSYSLGDRNRQILAFTGGRVLRVLAILILFLLADFQPLLVVRSEPLSAEATTVDNRQECSHTGDLRASRCFAFAFSRSKNRPAGELFRLRIAAISHPRGRRAPVDLRFSHDGVRKYVSTDLRVDPEKWRDGEVTRSHPQSATVSAHLRRVESKAQEALTSPNRPVHG